MLGIFSCLKQKEQVDMSSSAFVLNDRKKYLENIPGNTELRLWLTAAQADCEAVHRTYQQIYAGVTVGSKLRRGSDLAVAEHQ